MAQPWDIKLGVQFDILDEKAYKTLIGILKSGGIKWIWMAPPCWSHPAAQNGRIGGPLRSKEAPRGIDPANPVVMLGNALWNRAVDIFLMCLRLGVLATIERPLAAYSWKMCSTTILLQKNDVQRISLDQCNFPDPNRPRTKKNTGLLTNQPWLSLLVRKCRGDHRHDQQLHGASAKAAAAYSPAFARAIVEAYEVWRSAAKTTAVIGRVSETPQ